MVWGRNDPIIVPAAAEFVKQVVVPTADLHYFDASHFALDEHADAIASACSSRRSPDSTDARCACGACAGQELACAGANRFRGVPDQGRHSAGWEQAHLLSAEARGAAFQSLR
jgi:hypothetical protein